MTPLLVYCYAGWFANGCFFAFVTLPSNPGAPPEYRANVIKGDAFLALCPWALAWYGLAALLGF